ncbi:MAG: glycosyltransferase family 2 protein [Anaerolineales bacterium]|nr:glycosyltransferase family 2 protein [Anaerolineales bacterium]
MTKLAVVILTKNEREHIQDCIKSVSWADRVVVLDTFSTDDTVELARSAGAEVIQHTFENYSQIRNYALEVVDSPWIFFLDADERCTAELAEEIPQVIDRQAVGWWAPRYNYIFGRLTKGAGWYPDYQMRLLRRGYAHYERPVHEIVVLDGKDTRLKNHLLHYNYKTPAQFHAKQARYTDLDARILFEQGTRSRFYTPISQAARQFFWRFITLKGYRDKFHGLHLCMLMAWYEAVKYFKLQKLWTHRTK